MEPTKDKKQKETKSKEKVYLVIIFLLIVAIGFLIWQLVDQGMKTEIANKENIELALDNQEVERELKSLEVNFEELETDNDEMQARIDSQKVRIADYQVELAAAQGDKKKMRRLIAKLKKETETLRTIMKGYVVTIDSLNTLNMRLANELGDTRGKLSKANDDISKLNSDKSDLSQKVAIGAALETENIISGAIRVRDGGGQKETSRAKNANMIKTCFDVRENKLAKSENKDFYIRVITPDGSVLRPASEDTHFEWSDGKGFYTVKVNQEYKNAPMSLCAYFEIEGGPIPSGDYLTEIYADGNRIGKAYFKLK